MSVRFKSLRMFVNHVRIRFPRECQYRSTRRSGLAAKREPKTASASVLHDRLQQQRELRRVIFQVGVLNHRDITGHAGDGGADGSTLSAVDPMRGGPRSDRPTTPAPRRTSNDPIGASVIDRDELHAPVDGSVQDTPYDRPQRVVPRCRRASTPKASRRSLRQRPSTNVRRPRTRLERATEGWSPSGAYHPMR